MATFSENQVRHLYVVDAAADFSAAKSGEALYFVMKDANGQPLRSDLIENISYAKATDAAKMQRKTKVVKVTMDAAALSSGAPIAGEDYTLRIEYRQFIAQSDETFYHEFASAHATTSSTVGTLLYALADNLAKNTKKQEMVKVALMGGSTKATSLKATAFSASTAYAVGDVVTYSGEVYVFNATHSAGAWNASHVDAIDALLIEEIEQPWSLGTVQETRVLFEVATGTVVVSGDEMVWGAIADVTASQGTAIGNGKTIADMEYFYHGERGDIYRNISWPQVIPTKYMVDASKEYDTIDINYAFIGEGNSVQKSNKTITVVCPQTTGSTHAVVNAVINKINTAAGTTLLSTL